MAELFDDWQGNTLRLPVSLRLKDCERINWERLNFPAAAICVDAAVLESVDSIGVAALVVLLRKARAQQVSIEWINISRPLRNMLAVYELDNGAFLSCRNN